jgi:hypothetical protein
MANDVQIVVRLPRELAKQVDAVLKLAAKSERFRGAGLSKAAVVRMALDRGLAVLRAELEADRAK